MDKPSAYTDKHYSYISEEHTRTIMWLRCNAVAM